jgi:uncharacterized protein YceH (UPF0502 family)
MTFDLSAAETRVLGALLEKQLTTPDVYPLTLNGLRLACNQSTNRDPVVSYEDQTIREALRGLERRGLTRLASGAGSRAAKYRHLLAERLPMTEDERAIICVLMLRGHQTPGELKQRTERMHAFGDFPVLQETLERLIGRELVARLDRRPGQKEERYAELLTDREHAPAASTAAGTPARTTAPEPAAGTTAPEPAAGTMAPEPPAATMAPEPPAATMAPEPPAASTALEGAPERAASELRALAERVERLERELAELREALAVTSGVA